MHVPLSINYFTGLSTYLSLLFLLIHTIHCISIIPCFLIIRAGDHSVSVRLLIVWHVNLFHSFITVTEIFVFVLPSMIYYIICCLLSFSYWFPVYWELGWCTHLEDGLIPPCTNLLQVYTKFLKIVHIIEIFHNLLM